MYVISMELNLPMEEAVARLAEAISEEGLSFVSDINVQSIMMASFKEPFRPYRILGACAPGLAKSLIGIDAAIGALLPCNILVQELEGRTQIDIVDPVAILGLADQRAIDDLASQWRSVLQEVRARLEDWCC
jgi:uncharacterized protein (DUF302 family)